MKRLRAGHGPTSACCAFDRGWPVAAWGLAFATLVAAGSAAAQQPAGRPASMASAPSPSPRATAAPAVHSASSVPAAPATAAAPAAAASGAAPVLSASAQRLYEQARHQLVQVRTLLRGQDSQASVGSGFFVGDDGLILTNYHVVSMVALAPQRYRLTFGAVDGQSGALDLLAFDAIHDLAVVRMHREPPAASRPVGASGATPAAGTVRPAAPSGLSLRPKSSSLAKGERIYSLGNPLDVGFAVVEGTYNGLVERSFYPSIFFSGSLNPGMSGGPTLDENGRVMGINVATRLDGQQVSFLVPAEFAADLLKRARSAQPVTAPVYPELTRQLLAHQAALTERFIAQPWRDAGHPRYRIPVPQESFLRCWGESSPPEAKGLEFERSTCSMNSAVYVTQGLNTGRLNVRHETYDGSRLGPLRFARQYSASFRNEWFGGGRQRTSPRCTERFIDQSGMPLRAVLCMSAYKKLPGLYDVSVLVATLDAGTERGWAGLGETGAQGRFDAYGVSFANGLRLADHYLEGYGWTKASTPARTAR